MGTNSPEISASVEDVLSACQRLVSQKASACHDAGKDSDRSAEFARACFEQYVEGVADVMDAIGSNQLGDTMRTFAQYKMQQLKELPRHH
ncbi:hypothetical protein T35B1_17011 [Salinisphaera shabanensis T35B1]|uniref:hypothetical protein n=1 Tax=Salinisphaera shabanensis TaxID=180542 RepID=UPI0033400C5C